MNKKSPDQKACFSFLLDLMLSFTRAGSYQTFLLLPGVTELMYTSPMLLILHLPMANSKALQRTRF